MQSSLRRSAVVEPSADARDRGDSAGVRLFANVTLMPASDGPNYECRGRHRTRRQQTTAAWERLAETQRPVTAANGLTKGSIQASLLTRCDDLGRRLQDGAERVRRVR